jgi:hypothetical protein
MHGGVGQSKLKSTVRTLRFRATNIIDRHRNRRLGGRQLCFLHIGKTAGTSLQHALFEAMAGKRIFHESLPNFDRASAGDIASNDLVVGHFGFQHVAKMRRDRFLFTFLRDPVDRVLSNYHFLRTGSPISDYSRVAIEASKKMSLKEFLLCEDPRVRMVTENFQAKALAHDVRYDHQGAIRDLAREASDHLGMFDFVGIVEYFDESVKALSQQIGIDLAIKKLNVNQARGSARRASAEEISIIKDLNLIDTALYLCARTEFQREYLGN